MTGKQGHVIPALSILSLSLSLFYSERERERERDEKGFIKGEGVKKTEITFEIQRVAADVHMTKMPLKY